MKIERVSGKLERQVLTGLIVDKTVLGRVASKWVGLRPGEGLFKTQWGNVVAAWCVDYFKRYNDAPGKNVQGLFEAWAVEATDKETVQLVDKFLQGLSDEYETLAEESNADYVTDQASKHFNAVKLERMIEQVQGSLDLGKVNTARKVVTAFSAVEMGTGAGVDVLRDEQAMQEAFEDDLEPLFEFPGALGEFFNKAMTRGSFVAFLAPEKRGKTFWLTECAWRAMQHRRKVAFFSVGDMTQKQMMRRFLIRAAKRPLRAKSMQWPVSMQRGDEGVEVAYEKRNYDKPLSFQSAKAACDDVILRVRSKQTLLRLSVHPTNSLTVAAMDSILDDWERDGWVPDVIVIDYIDILLMEGTDERDKTNTTWKNLRGLSQRRHALVLGATQADAASYTVEVMTRSNFSEDKRKLAHVTGMPGINQTLDEKKKGIARLNWIVLREGEFSEDQCVHVAGCLDAGCPAVKSCW